MGYSSSDIPFFIIGKICKNSVQFIFAGKAYPKDTMGKDYIKELHEKGEYLYDNYGVKVVMMENYNMDLSHMLVSGVDIWLNTPERYREASGTSGMKAALNGVLNLSVQDGWWLEGIKKQPNAGWGIGPDDSNPDDPGVSNDWDIDSTALYNILENEVIPTYMNHDDRLGVVRYALFQAFGVKAEVVSNIGKSDLAPGVNH